MRPQSAANPAEAATCDGPLDQQELWCRLLADAAPRDHIVQLYQDQQFLNRAVCRFAAGALANGEAVILVPTVAHWDAFRPRLEAEGVDIAAVEGCGQLTVVDADELLPSFMREAMPDAPLFLGLAADVVDPGGDTVEGGDDRAGSWSICGDPARRSRWPRLAGRVGDG